ncbi:MAG: tripartite tricarboxylate transporter TctB family protein [Burkholderiaceae bacterium]
MSDRLLGAVCVVAAAGMAWYARGYTAPISYEPVGPRAFPMLLAAFMATGGAWLMLKPTLRGGTFEGVRRRPLALSALAIVVYAMLFQTLGFPLATALMAVPVGRSFGGTWKQSLAGGIGLGVGLYLLFDKLLDVVLPTGVLSVLLGGH